MDTHDDQGEWLTVDQAAVRLGKSPKTLRRWIQNGRLPAERLDTPYGWAYRINVQALDQAVRAVDVVPSRTIPDSEALTRAIVEVLADRDAQQAVTLQQLQAVIEELRDEVRVLREQRDPSPGPSPAQIGKEPSPSREGDILSAAKDEPTPAHIPTAAPRRRSWWRRLLGQG